MRIQWFLEIRFFIAARQLADAGNDDATTYDSAMVHVWWGNGQ